MSTDMITAGSARELLARAPSRNRAEPADARAGAVFERVTVDAESFFVKRLSASSDWIMRIAGDHVHRPYLIWRSGIMNQAPGLIDHTVVAMDLTGPPDELCWWEARVTTAVARQLIPLRRTAE